MIRLIKRYGSRKLYDTEESRYVALEEIGEWVRRGQQVKVQDTTTQEDVTAQTLALVIVEEGKRGSSFFTSDVLHGLIRRGQDVLSTGVEQLQNGVDRAVRASIDRIPPLRDVRNQAADLRLRLEKLESTIEELADQMEADGEANPMRATDRRPFEAASTGINKSTAARRKGVHS